MKKEKPLWEKLYFDAEYVEIARLIGYQGTTYRDMLKMLEPLEAKFGKVRVHSAVHFLVIFEGQMTCNPRPLAEVKLRPEVRRLCWSLLGPPPEQMEAFMTNPDGSSRHPKQTKSSGQKSPSKKGPPSGKNEPQKKARKKKTEPAKPTEKTDEKFAAGNRSAANDAPIMAQYRAAKEKHPDMMLLFRVGDSYELFDQDAEEASKLLGLTLTTRNQTQTMVGFPHHALESYLQELLKQGKRVAVCDQVEDSLARATSRVC